jgi:hypothetical protein
MVEENRDFIERTWNEWHSTAEQREQVRISSHGLHWQALDEDISIDGLLAGLGDQTSSNKIFAA